MTSPKEGELEIRRILSSNIALEPCALTSYSDATRQMTPNQDQDEDNWHPRGSINIEHEKLLSERCI